MCKWYISVQYHFYAGTIGARKNGPLQDFPREDKKTFNSWHEAEIHLRKVMGCDKFTDRNLKTCYTYAGPYCLAHGEYDSPDYYIRKERKKNA